MISIKLYYVGIDMHNSNITQLTFYYNFMKQDSQKD